MSVRRILIVNLTRLGDLIQTSATVAGLRAAHPGATITLAAERNFAEVCEGIPGVDEVVRVDLDRLGVMLLEGPRRLPDAFRHVRDLVHELRARRFDLALNFSSSRMSAVLLGLLGGPDVRGWSMTPDGFRAIRHPWARLFAAQCLNRRFACFNLVDCYRGVAGCLGTPARLHYRVADAARGAVRERLAALGVRSDATLVALQLGASRASRRWPADAFARLARELEASGLTVVLVGGPGERALAEAVQPAAGEVPLVDLCGRTSLGELAALLERSALLVTGDTGPMHLAAALDTPVVGLFFGPALAFDTGPYGEGHVVVQARVACAPCDHEARCLDPFCRDAISPELVARIVRARLAGDLQAVAEAARGHASVRVYRTGFDRHGLFECRPLGAPPPGREDLLRQAYRAVWLARLEGAALPEPLGCAIDTAAFAALAGLARSGEALAARLGVALGGAGDPDAMARLGREIEALDREIAVHGKVHPEAALLTQTFAFDKENLQGEELPALLEESAALYRALGRSAGEMQALLAGGPAERTYEGADLHQ